MNEKLLDFNAYTTWMKSLPSHLRGFNHLRIETLPDYNIETDSPQEFANNVWQYIYDDAEEIDRVVETVDSLVTTLKLTVANNPKYALGVLQSEIPVVTTACIVDCEGVAGRFELQVSFYPEENKYFLNVSNFGRQVTLKTTTHLPNFVYALMDTGFAKIDAEVIQRIFEEVSVADLEKKMQETYNRPLIN